MKATILAEIIKGHESLEELRTDIKREEALKNSKDVTYHLMRGKNSLKGMGLIAIRGRKVTLTVKDTEGLVTVMSILLSNDEIFWRILPELASLHRMAWLFVHDKWHFQNQLRLIRDTGFYSEYLNHLKGSLLNLASLGWDAENITMIHFGSVDVLRYVPLMLYVIAENLRLDQDVRNGVRDPEFHFVGSVDYLSLRDIHFAPSKTGENEYPYIRPRNEEKAIEEFVLGFLRPVLNGQNPELSMYHPPSERLRLLMLLDRAEMTLQQMTRTTALNVAKLRVDETIQVDVEEPTQEPQQGDPETVDIFDTSIRH